MPLAPEVLLDHKPVFATDMWGLGMLVLRLLLPLKSSLFRISSRLTLDYERLMGFPLEEMRTDNRTLETTLRAEIGNENWEDYGALLQGLLQANPEMRMNLEAVLASKPLQSLTDFSSKEK